MTQSLKRALRPWNKEALLTQGVRLGNIPSHRTVVSTDASLTGWGAVWEGRMVRGSWNPCWRGEHINVLELRAVHLALRELLPHIRFRHVLVRSDNSSAVYHINHQGGTRSLRNLQVARKLLEWAFIHIASLRAVFIPGVQNRAADLLSRTGPLPGEWRLHPEVVAQLWSRFGRAHADLFASSETTHCDRWFSIKEDNAPLGLDVLSRDWPVCLPSFSPTPSRAPQDPHGSLQGPADCSQVAEEALVSRSPPSASWATVASSSQGRSPVPRGRAGLAPRSSSASVVGMATAQRACYGQKWRVFSGWCVDRHFDPAASSVHSVLNFLQLLLDAGKAASTVKVYVAAISSIHHTVDGLTMGRHPLVCQFLRGAHRLRPGRALRAPSWDLTMVLHSLAEAPYEPLDTAELKWLTQKTAFLLAICSAKRVSELHALSVSDQCLRWKADYTGVSLWPNPSFLPKVVNPQTLNQVIEISSLSESAHRVDSPTLVSLCPVRALRTYVARTQSLRRSHLQLFVCYGGNKSGEPVSKQRLSHWVVDTISHAYDSQNLPVPGHLVAHSTRSTATSWAALRGVPVADICAAASWSTPCTFTQFYRVNVAAAAPLSLAVLSAARRT